MQTEFYEIDCDELEFPNLTTIDSLPNEILAMIKDYKIKLEINDIYQEIEDRKKSSLVYINKINIERFNYNCCMKNYNKKAALKDGFNFQVYLDKYNQMTNNNIADWNKLNKKLFKNLKIQRSSIITYFKNFNYDEIIAWSNEIGNHSIRTSGYFRGQLWANTDINWPEFDKQLMARSFWLKIDNNYNDYNEYMAKMVGYTETEAQRD